MVAERVIDWLRRFGLRWVLVYFALYVFLGEPIDAISDIPGFQFLSWAVKVQKAFWNAVVPWIGSHLFAHSIPLYPNWDAGERLFNYAENGIIVALALLVALLWASIDRNREPERKCYEGIRILLRYTLALILLLAYGVPKLFPCGFFPCLEPALLMQPFGDLPPYAFMFFLFGYTYPYSVLIGFAEAAGGVLLLFRRTTTLGALLLAAVLANVAILDVLYGVEVRLFSANLALMALFLLAPEAERIAKVVLGYAAPAVPPPQPSRRPWIVAAATVNVLIFGVALFYEVPFWLQATKQRFEAQRRPMAGYYQVDSIQPRGPKQSVVPEKSAWQMVDIDRSGPYDTLHARTTASAVKSYRLQIKPSDRTGGLFYLIRCADADYSCRFISDLHQFAPTTDSKSIVLRYSVTGASMLLNGSVDGEQVLMRLHRLAQSPFLLQRTGIHLIDPDDYVWSI